MKDFLLSRADRSPGRRDTATVALTEERGDTFFDALSSETSRRLFQALHERPSTPSELAEEFDTSRQNVHYHIEKLEVADLVEPIDTVYSSRGREMRVYAPTHEAIVLVSGGESTVDRVRTALSRFLGGLVVLLLAGLLLQAAVVGVPDLADGAGAPSDVRAPPTAESGDGGAGGGGSTPTATFVQRGDAADDERAQHPTDESGGTAAAGPETAGGADGAATDGTADEPRDVSGGGAGDAGESRSPTATPGPTTTPPPPTGTDRSPVVYFLAGGVFALAVSVAWQYRR